MIRPLYLVAALPFFFTGCALSDVISDTPILADLPVVRDLTNHDAPPPHEAPIPTAYVRVSQRDLVVFTPLPSPTYYQTTSQYEGMALGCLPVAAAAVRWCADHDYRSTLDSTMTPPVMVAIHQVGDEMHCTRSPSATSADWREARRYLSAHGVQWRTAGTGSSSLSACVNSGETALIYVTVQPSAPHACWLSGSGTMADGRTAVRLSMGWPTDSAWWVVEAGSEPVPDGTRTAIVGDVVAVPVAAEVPKSIN